MNIFIPIIIIVIIATILWGWSTVLRKIPLVDYGMENVERLLKMESEEYRIQVLKRGWITNKEWVRLQKKHQKASNELEKNKQ